MIDFLFTNKGENKGICHHSEPDGLFKDLIIIFCPKKD